MSIADEMSPQVLAFMDEELGGIGGDTSFGDEEEDEEEEGEEDEEGDGES